MPSLCKGPTASSSQPQFRGHVKPLSMRSQTGRAWPTAFSDGLWQEELAGTSEQRHQELKAKPDSGAGCEPLSSLGDDEESLGASGGEAALTNVCLQSYPWLCSDTGLVLFNSLSLLSQEHQPY